MGIELRHANPLEVLDSINYIDSALFGFSIDIFKIRLFLTVRQSSELMKFGFEQDYAYLCFEFRVIRNLRVNMDKAMFAPPYLDDGDLSAVDLFDFDFEILDIKKAGQTGHTDRLGEYKELHDIYEIKLTFRDAMLQFQFVNLEIREFDPLDLDKTNSLNLVNNP
jgi:hypothetical protein